MKKALLAVAVLATFGSGSALAAFGTETEGTTPVTGNITMGGKINPPASTWLAAIDAAPEELNNVVVDSSVWNGKAGAYTYDVSTYNIPLVYVRTKTSTAGGYPKPSITIAGSQDLLNNQGVTVNDIQVGMDPNLGADFKPTSDVKLDVTFKSGWAVGAVNADGKAVGVVTTAGPATPGITENFSAKAVSLAMKQNLPIAQFDEDGPRFTWGTAMDVINAQTNTSVTAAAVVGMVDAKLKSTRVGRPTGTWQATLPVEVTYN